MSKTKAIRSLLVSIAVLCAFSGAANGESFPIIPFTPKDWKNVGFPQDLDRHVPLTEAQWATVQAFNAKMEEAIQNRKNDDEIAIYADIMKSCLTPLPGDAPDWCTVGTNRRIRLFAGTRYAKELIPLLAPIMRSYPDDDIRVHVAFSMAILGDKDHVHDVMLLLSSKDETVRKLTHRTLNLMGYDIPSQFDDKAPSPAK